MTDSNAELYRLISWVCFFVGWFFGLSIIVFPIGIILGNKAIEGGVDASLIKKLNKWSLIFIVGFLVFILFILFLLAAL